MHKPNIQVGEDDEDEAQLTIYYSIHLEGKIDKV